jgi:hypothetical protein
LPQRFRRKIAIKRNVLGFFERGADLPEAVFRRAARA